MNDQMQRDQPPVAPSTSRPARRAAPLAASALVMGVLGFAAVRHFAPAPSAAKGADAPSPDAGGDGAENAPVPVQVTHPVLRPMETLVSGDGTLSPAPGASARVAATSAGRVLSVFVREGDRVRAGQLLARLDNRAAQAQAQSARAQERAAGADAQSASLSAGAAQSDARSTLAQAQAALQSALADRDAGVQSARAALESAQSDLRKASTTANPGDLRSAVQQARLALRAAQSDRRSAIAQAQNALQTTQTDLSRTLAGARAPELTAAQAALSQAQATQSSAQTQAARAQRLFDRGLYSRRQLEDAQTALSVAQGATQSAQAQLDLLRAGARPEDVTAARLRVEAAREALRAAGQSGSDRVAQAQAQLAAAQQSGATTARSRGEDVRAARGRIASAQAQLAAAIRSGAAKVASAQEAVLAARSAGLTAQARAQDAASKRAAQASSVAAAEAAQAVAGQNEVRAPLAGVVTKRNLNPGDVADPATPIVEIADPGALDLLAQLPSDEGAPVRAGQGARVSSTSAPGVLFNGRVESVGSVDPASGLLSVRIAVLGAGGQLRSGTLAHADIVVARRPLALAVPKTCVLTRDGKSVVFSVEGDKAHAHNVQVGASSGGWVEVRGAVKSGDSVVALGQYELSDGASVEVKARQ